MAHPGSRCSPGCAGVVGGARSDSYLYNGKELNEDYEINLMDYGARWYDGAIGRWTAVDPLAEVIPSHSPFHYVFNNPIRINDPTGMMGELPEAAQFQKEESHAEIEAEARSKRNNSDNEEENCCPGQPDYDALYGIRDEQGTLVGWDDPVAGFIENDPPENIAHALGRMFSLGALPEIKLVGSLWKFLGFSGKNGAVVKANTQTTSLVDYWPSNGGALGKWENTYLMPGTEIDRIGSGFGQYFSPRGTPINMRALPAGNPGNLNAYRVVKPISVQVSTIAPAFNQVGLGTQYLAPVSANTLLKKGFIVPIK